MEVSVSWLGGTKQGMFYWDSAGENLQSALTPVKLLQIPKKWERQWKGWNSGYDWMDSPGIYLCLIPRTWTFTCLDTKW